MRTTYSKGARHPRDKDTAKATLGKEKKWERKKEGREEVSRQQGPPSRRGASERPRPGRERTWPILGGADAPGRSGDLRGGHRRRGLKVGYSWSARTLDAGMG